MGVLSLQLVAIGWCDCWFFAVPFFTAVCRVARLSIVGIMHHYFGLLFRFLASCRDPYRAGKAMSNCNNKFGNFDLRLAFFCMQAVHIVECIGVENCPWALSIA